MNESLFQISCPSCESVFAVTDPELIGQIVACPKCGGMMLVEAARSAEIVRDAEDARSARETASGENREVSEGGAASASEFDAPPVVVEPGVAPPVVRGENESATENERNAENEGNREAGRNGEGLTAANEGGGRSPLVGTLVGVAVALLVLGAVAFFLTRGARDGVSEPIASDRQTENGEIGETGEINEGGQKDEVGGFAPRAVEERTPDAPLPDAAIADMAEEESEIEKTESLDGIGESGEISGLEEMGGTDGSQDGEETAPADASEKNDESPTNETSSTDDSTNVDWNESGEKGVLNDLGSLGDLGGELDEEIGTLEDAELEDESETAPEKLAGSNASTGFNEADFERANQNDDPESAEEPAEVDWSGVASTTNPTLQGALPTLRRERKEIDVDARLALPIKSIEFPSSPVAAIRLLSEFSGVSIVPDLETFVLTRPATTATLDLSLRDATAGEALETVAELLNCEVHREKNRLLIRPAGFDADAFVEERFDVADLIAQKNDAVEATRFEEFELPCRLTSETLAAFVRSLVAPESWLENGGRATLKIDGTTLIVGQTAQNREKTRILLEGLRAIRGLEPQTDATPERIIPEKLGWENLTKKTTFNPLTPPALQNAVEILEKAQKFQAFWDDATLNEAGVDRDATTSARVEGETVDAALTEILEPLNATYLILGERLIFVTSKEAAEDYETIEFFSLLGEGGARPTADEARDLVAEMKAAVAPTTWTVGASSRTTGNGGNAENAKIEENDEETKNLTVVAEETSENETSATLDEEKESDNGAEIGENSETASTGEIFAEERRAVVWLDVESACLIIRQSQPNQRATRRWLAARTTKTKPLEKESEEEN
ncbi:MAG: hypothetical protein IKU86_07105 [Thermoguttaceae bacterium]|nr:hypothetical protein [Thermoguttaceae bacterium]